MKTGCSKIESYEMKWRNIMLIRLAQVEDLDAIIEIEAICFPVEEAASKEAITERFNVFMDNFVVAEENGQVVGFINGCCYHELSLPDELYHDSSLHDKSGAYQTVFGLDVLPAYRKNGVARQLVEFFIALAKQRGKHGIVLTCKDHLVHYYERFGFVHQGVSDSTHGGAKWNDMHLIFKDDTL